MRGSADVGNAANTPPAKPVPEVVREKGYNEEVCVCVQLFKFSQMCSETGVETI